MAFAAVYGIAVYFIYRYTKGRRANSRASQAQGKPLGLVRLLLECRIDAPLVREGGVGPLVVLPSF